MTKVSPEKNMAFIYIVTRKKSGSQMGSLEKKPLIFSGDPIWEPDFFPVIKFDVQFFSGDNANESHNFCPVIPVSKEVGLRKLSKNIVVFQ